MNVMGCIKKRTKDYEQGYEKGYEAGRVEGVKFAVKFLLYSMIQFLGDKRGWTRESIFKAILWVHKHAEMINEELTTFDEVMEAVKDEYGIVFDDERFVLLQEGEWK